MKIKCFLASYLRREWFIIIKFLWVLNWTNIHLLYNMTKKFLRRGYIYTHRWSTTFPLEKKTSKHYQFPKTIIFLGFKNILKVNNGLPFFSSHCYGHWTCLVQFRLLWFTLLSITKIITNYNKRRKSSNTAPPSVELRK